MGGGDGTVSVFNPLRPPTVLDSLDHVWKLKGAVTSLSFVDGRGLRADADGLEVVDKVVAYTSEGMKYLCPTRKSVRERGSGSDEASLARSGAFFVSSPSRSSARASAVCSSSRPLSLSP